MQLDQETIIRILSDKLSDNDLLLSTHSRLSIPIINRIYHKMKLGIKFDDIKTFDNIIVDGHHRYVSSVLASYKLETVKSHLSRAAVITKWQNVHFVDEEWDTIDKIKRLNAHDAQFNGMSIEELEKMIIK